MYLLSEKHIAPCPLCGRPSRACRGHTAEAYDAPRIKAEREKIRGTDEWRAANKRKREALNSNRRRYA